MPCYRIFKDGHPVGFICGRLGPQCTVCGSVSDVLCDFPVGEDQSCDRKICENCATKVGPDTHYCRDHAEMWATYVCSCGALPFLFPKPAAT